MGRKILITGASGFAGSHLLDYLIEHYSDNILSGTYYTEKGLENLDAQKNKVELVKVDLRNEKETSELIKKIMPDVVYHLAAFTSPAEIGRAHV